MVAWTALAGAIVAWTVVLGLGAAAGYGLVEAWGRFGSRATLPPRVRRVVDRLLGPAPVAAVLAPQVSPPEPPAPTATPAAPAVAASTPPAAPAPATRSAGGDDAASRDGAVAEPAVAAMAAVDDAADPAPAAAAPAAEAVPAPAPAAPRLDRADAIAEAAGVFGLSYEEAIAFVDAGLVGADNFEAWSRSVRGGAPPAGVPEQALRRVLGFAPADVARQRDAYRAKLESTRQLEGLWGVGPDEAEALFVAGFKDLASIRKASTDKLAKVPGIGAARAFQIRAAAHGLAPTP